MNLRELSESLGLSQTTVSRALNGYPEVREATRLRVQKAAEAANYLPNSRARRLATGRAMAIGHVMPLNGREELVNPIFADFIAGAGEVYGKDGFDLHLSMVPADCTEAAYRQMAANASVDAVMVQAPTLDDARVPLLKDLGLPFLIHGRTADPQGYSWLDVANVRAFRRATDLLLDLGHRRIALLNGQETLDFALRRRRGFEEALTARGLTPRPDFLHSDVMTEQYGYRTARALLDRDDAPTAFVVSSIIPAIGVRRAAGERGLRTGHDISIICHDDVLSYIDNDGMNAPEGPAFTATRSSIRAAGRRCAEILLSLIDDPDQPHIQEIWETDLTLGRSTGPAPT
ncbi:substrate-binding domain-containing protein [Jannaschia sp. CCS1]|uniref:substrate-binding domain-containing protein n=1 Tax=Jannaschia sp. (strain CCS1) TaxID=290400 RepID=UPI000053B12A|nr:substrate-binding domain-containing protein [Jannaschia sp. CCS1]ABD54862.1 transcriptional regulator, LacI family [Jannaschia sp. CCS1]